MTQSVVDWLVVLFFLIALAFVSRFRRTMRAVDAASYQHISAGLVILSVIALARLYAELGAFERLPFLSEPLFFKLVSWIGIITGIMFLISGVSSWLPLAKKLEGRDTQERTSAQLIREVEQLLAVEHRMDPLLSNILTHIVDTFQYRAGAVFTVAATSHESRLVSSVGEADEVRERLQEAFFDLHGWKRYLEGYAAESSGMFTNLPVTLGTPSLLVPIVVSERPRAVFAAWSGDRTHVTYDDRLQLKLVSDILARRMREEVTQVKNRFLMRCASLRDEVRRAMDTSGARPESLPIIMRHLSEVLPIDYLSLVLLHPTRPVCDRYSVGADNRLLTFKGMPWPGRNETLARIMASDEPSISQRRPNQLDDFPPGFLPPALEEVALAPIRFEGQPGGLLILGAERSRAFGRRTAALLEVVTSTLAQLVYSHVRRAGDVSWEARLVRLYQLAHHSDRTENPGAWLDRATEFLADELGFETVRISACDPDGRFLNSRALRTPELSPHMAPATESMILALMPAHTETLETGEVVYVEGDEALSRSSEAERMSVYRADLAQLLIVPIVRQRRTLGVITAADSRTRGSFAVDDGSLALVSATAWMLADADIGRPESVSLSKASKAAGFDEAIRRSLTHAMLTDTEETHRAATDELVMEGAD
jgi:hypothetical protein